ncbi:MAG: YgfZ/GcvT domain-containing protein [Myxococcota bacterium]
MHETALSAMHAQAGADLEEVDGVAIPTRLGDPMDEWRAAREGAALFDLSWRTHLAVTGRHRQRFLHNMTTCEIKALEPGQGNFGMAVDGKGKLVAGFYVEADEDRFYLEVARARRGPFVAQMKRYIVADDVQFVPEDGRTVLGLVGPHADEALERALGEPPGVDTDYHWRRGTVAGVTVRIRRDPHRLARPGWTVTVADEDAPAVWSALAEAGATPAGHETFDALRIRAGVPRDGLDMTEANIPLESRALYDTVDWDKGCYIGQEVIAMMHYRGKPSRHLRAVRLPAGATPPPPGSHLQTPEGKKAGVLGTASTHPALPGPVGLAVVKRKLSEAGTPLVLEDGTEAEVADLPLELPE